MRKRLKVSSSCVLAIFLIVSLLAGCASSSTPAKSATPASSSTPAASAAPSSTSTPEANISMYPVVTKPLTLSYWVSMDPKATVSMKSYSEILYYQKLAEITGVTFKFIHPPVGQEKEQFNILIASGDLPDIIEYGWNSSSFPGGAEKAVQDGIIIPINSLVEKNAPDYKKIIDQYPEVKKQLLTDKGNMCVFGDLFIDPAPGTPHRSRFTDGYEVRRDWLKKVGINELPTTIDDWYAALTAIKKGDPNGNGKADEIPLVSLKLQAITNFTTAWGGMAYGFYYPKGKVVYGPSQPEFKEYLATMQKWYKEGLIDVDFPTTDQKSFDAKILGDVAGSWFAQLMGGLGKYVQTKMNQNQPFDAVGLILPVLKKGETPYINYARFEVGGAGVAITTKNKYPAETAKVLNYAYSQKGHMLFNFGEEGNSYKMENGYPKYTDFILNNPNKLTVDQAIARIGRGSIASGGYLSDTRVYEQRAALPAQVETFAIWSKAKMDYRLPPASIKVDDIPKYSNIMNQVNTYVDEMLLKFIMGQEPLSNFDKFIENLNKIGIAEATKIQQEAVDRYNARK